MSKQKPLVSVVTPVYNGEKYLAECINSVLSQTYNHWDYTIVNNRSTDRTLDIARDYASRDARIRIHNNETFVRVIENYNIAFRQISPQSKYCKVVAGDDLLFPECIEKMVRLAEEHPNVAIVASYGLHGSRVVNVGLPYPNTVVRGREVCRLRLLGGPYVFGTGTSVLYRSDIVRSRHAFYNESNLHADAEACYEFLVNHDFGFVHQVLSFIRVREGSLTSFSDSFQTYLPEVLYNLLRYGPQYLSENELKKRLSEAIRNYYRYLGKQVYERRDQEFWRFHKGKLATLGYPLSTPRLTAAAASYALDIVLNPKRGVEGATRRVLRKLSKSHPDKILASGHDRAQSLGS
jgi:glycosyltransferase involved in cell wall biosynthesis